MIDREKDEEQLSEGMHYTNTTNSVYRNTIINHYTNPLKGKHSAITSLNPTLWPLPHTTKTS